MSSSNPVQNGQPSENVWSYYAPYLAPPAAASAAIVTESISGLALIPETNYVESLSALIDNHNGTWIAPASGDYKITNGN